MPKFADEWVVDRTMFEFVSGGSCQCCGFSHLFNPDGIRGLINAVSDLETDAANAELSAAERSPWPPEMRDQVWADRVRLRHKMKKEMKIYKEFFEEFGRDGVERWMKESLGVEGLRKLFQMPRTEVTERVGSQYNIHSAFAIVLCAVVEQVANFPATKYETDARGPEEITFEQTLQFDRRCGFTLPISNANDGTLRDDVLKVFIDMMVSLGGPKLLHRGPKTTTTTDEDEDEEGGADDAAAAGGEFEKGKKGPSFRADRRIIRLLIVRYWSDQIMKKFKEDKMKNENGGETKEEVESGE